MMELVFHVELRTSSLGPRWHLDLEDSGREERLIYLSRCKAALPQDFELEAPKTIKGDWITYLTIFSPLSMEGGWRGGTNWAPLSYLLSRKHDPIQFAVQSKYLQENDNVPSNCRR